MKYVILLLPFLWVSCSQDSAAPTAPLQVTYGHEPWPGVMKPLPRAYRPLGLSEKVFSNGQVQFVAMDILEENLTLTFDVATQKVEATAILLFRQTAAGHAYFQLHAGVDAASLDGTAVTLTSVKDPDGVGREFQSVNEDRRPWVESTLTVNYSLPSSKFNFSDGGVGFLTDMSDLEPSQFFEEWAPAGFEDDAFSLTAHLLVKNATHAHQVFSNGSATPQNANEWLIEFPAHYTISSFYIHLTDRPLNVTHFSIQGVKREIPITVYSTEAALADQARAELPALFAELEGVYGPYIHDGFVAYIQPGQGGMEYSGATITSIDALDHELFHSWFARGVMPAEGRSGWIDEAIASWRDHDYFHPASLLSRPPTMLANYSPYAEATPGNSYHDGRELLAELDVVLAPFGGLRVLLREFFARYQNRVITTEEFQYFIEQRSGRDVSAYFNRYVFGKASVTTEGRGPDRHPRRLTPQELRALR